MRRLLVLILALALASPSWATGVDRCCAEGVAGGEVQAGLVVASALAASDGADRGSRDGDSGDPGVADAGDVRCACGGSVVCADCDALPMNALLRSAPAARATPSDRVIAGVGWYVTAGVRSELLRPPRERAA